MSYSPLYLSSDLDTIGWLRVLLVYDCYLFNRLSQENPLTFRELTSREVDIGMAVVQSQVSRKGYHTKTVYSKL